MRKTKGDLNMKVDLKDLAAAFAQSDVRQGYVDIRAGKVVMMADDMAEEEAMHHAFAMEEDWEHYIPIPNVMDEDETAMMHAFAESRPREDVKERLLCLRDTRITQDGVVVIKAQQYRSQEQNRADALDRLNALVQSVAQPPRTRRATKPTYGSRQRRLQAKTQRGETKALRGKVRD